MRSKLRPGERVLTKTQKHWSVLARPVALLSLFVLFLLLLPESLAEFRTPLLIIILCCAGYLAVAFYRRKANIWVVTDMRIIDEWGLFTHNAKESSLDKINNVFCRQSPLGRLLGYGDIEIQTAAEQGASVITLVSHPRELQEAIAQAQLANKGKREIPVDGETRECPYCAEIIKAKARVCRFCGRELP